MKILKKYEKGGTPKYDQGGFTLTKEDVKTLRSNILANQANFKDTPMFVGTNSKFTWDDVTRSGNLKITFNEKGQKVLMWRGQSMVIPKGSSLDKSITPTMTADMEKKIADYEKRKNLAKEEVVKVGPIKEDKIKVDSEGNPIEDKKDEEKPKEEVKDAKNERKQTPLSIKPVMDTTIEDLAKPPTKLPEEGRPKVEPTKAPEKEERREYIPQTQRNDEEYTPQSMRPISRPSTEKMKKGGKVKLKKRKAMMGMIAKMAGGAAGGGAGAAMGKMKHGGVTKYKHGGSLKPVPEGSKGLKKLPKKVRNKMGYMKDGGMNKKSKKHSDDELKKTIEAVYKRQFQVPISEDINNPIFKTRYNEAKRIAQMQLNKGHRKFVKK